jgi:hypothetical protein
MRRTVLLAFTMFLAQQPRNFVAMAQRARAHSQLTEQTPPGRREKLDVGTLYIPTGLPSRPPLLVFFHGDTWIPEVAANSNRMAAISVLAGEGSGVYSRLFEDPQRFLRLLKEAEVKAHKPFGHVILGGWSAGCGALHQILRSPQSYSRVNAVICIDGVHADYVNGKPGPLESSLTEENLQVWLHLGRDAMAGHKRFLLTHSEIVPGTYASTTETADYLLKHLRVSPWGCSRSAKPRTANSWCRASPVTPRPTTWISCTPCRCGSSCCAELSVAWQSIVEDSRLLW